MDYLLFYQYVDDYVRLREPFRAEHLTRAWAAQDRGELVLAGALDPPDDAVFSVDGPFPRNGAVFHFTGDSSAAARAFAESDPYVRHRIVTQWSVRPWQTVVGAAASNPIHPDIAPH